MHAYSAVNDTTDKEGPYFYLCKELARRLPQRLLRMDQLPSAVHVVQNRRVRVNLKKNAFVSACVRARA